MALIDDVKSLCDRLAPLGWHALLERMTDGHLNIRQPNGAALRKELTKPLVVIDRSVAGLEDFAVDGTHAIAAGDPARSLLYHALASPGVVDGLTGFPTLRELETVENFVFGVQPPSLDELLEKAGQKGKQKLSIALFAYEYRPARDTCSRLQADMAFSRTGVGRVGTRSAQYDPRRRGFHAEVSDDPFAFRVCPARYGAFLAVRTRGSELQSAPMRALDDDSKRQFWIPLHKLFDGPECLRGMDLKLRFSSFHYNDKIRRTRAFSLRMPNVPARPPFQFSEGIAEFVDGVDWCRGLLMPVEHPRLVEPATVEGELLTFRVPRTTSNFAALEPGARRDSITGAEVRRAPAYVHARTQVLEGSQIDLSNDPTRPDVLKTVSAGRYEALHYVDFTGDGRIDVSIAALTGKSAVAAETVPCYSLIAAPDFFPDAGQRELFEAVPGELWGVEPHPLCDTRLPANLQMPGNRFEPKDDTITAIVPLFGPPPSASTHPFSRDASRHSCLPDDCAGEFAPGWDVSTDKKSSQGHPIHHLAAYGLGSPFPEDSKLCAALSTFWPAVAPDATRGMSPSSGADELRSTVAPLTDEEIGQSGSLPWDGVAGPTVRTIGGQEFAECESFLHVDYVQQALDGRFSLRLTARVSSEEYERRMRAMGLVYSVIGQDRNSRFVLSFRQVLAGNDELQDAQIDASVVLPGAAYRIDVIRGGGDTEQLHPTDFRKRLLPLIDRRFFLVDPANRIVLQRRAEQMRWSRATIPS